MLSPAGGGRISAFERMEQEKKKGSCRYDRIPRALLDEIRLEKRRIILRLISEKFA